MKNRAISLLLAVLFLNLAVFAISCDTKSDDSSESKTYNVHCQENQFIRYDARTIYTMPGFEAYVKVIPLYNAITVTAVYYDDNLCNKDSEEYKYTFTMPDKDVTVRVEVDAVETSSDNFLTITTQSPLTLTKVISENYYPNFDTENKVYVEVSKSPSQTGGYFTAHDETAISFNEEVIPTNAISIECFHSSSSNSAIGFELSIDRSLINVGTAKIGLLVDNNHDYNDSAMVVFTVNVTE